MLRDMTADDLITRLETYYDAVPRRRARVEEVGPFTLFVAEAGWPLYARPALEAGADEISQDDVRRVLDRQQELEVPRALEWVDEVIPGLAETVESTGVDVARCPLLVLDGQPRGDGGTARILGTDDLETLTASRAAVAVAFSHAGTATGSESVAERDAAMASQYAQVDDLLAARIDAGENRVAGVFVAGAAEMGPVGGGSYAAVGEVAEIAGVGVLPAFRRRGLAAQVTYVLATDAIDRGVTTVFCSAQSDDVARVYAGVGFRRVGTACIAEPTSAPNPA